MIFLHICMFQAKEVAVEVVDMAIAAIMETAPAVVTSKSILKILNIHK